MRAPWRNSAERYGLVAVSLHWLIAVMVIGMLGVGLYMTGLRPSPQMLKIYFFHKSFGILILMLAALRLGWKLANTRPAPLPGHRRWERALAKLIHLFLYVALFAMPLSGWIMSSAKGFSVSVFGWFTLPDFVPKSEHLEEAAEEFHEIVAWCLMAAIGLHVAGALKHQIIDRDGTLRRMLPAFRVVFFAALLFLVTGNSAAQDKPALPLWTIDHENSSLTFTATQMGAPFLGKFAGFDGTIAFDPAQPETGYATITIPVAGASTGSKDRDEYILMPPWLDAESFPESVYKVESFTHVEGNQYVARGQLTIRETTLPVDLPFTLEISTDDAGNKIAKMKGETTLQRLDFNVGNGEWADTEMVGNPVIVRVSLTATHAPGSMAAKETPAP